jgi:site-specific DNA-cytosine methylase
LKEDHVTDADATNGMLDNCNASMYGELQAMAVRRLTPVECERLQGFPDSYTDIKSKNKPTPDGQDTKHWATAWPCL